MKNHVCSTTAPHKHTHTHTPVGVLRQPSSTRVPVAAMQSSWSRFVPITHRRVIMGTSRDEAHVSCLILSFSSLCLLHYVSFIFASRESILRLPLSFRFALSSLPVPFLPLLIIVITSMTHHMISLPSFPVSLLSSLAVTCLTIASTAIALAGCTARCCMHHSQQAALD